MYKPTKTQFIDWLKAKKPGQHVGHSISYYGCPIARFATEMQDDVHMASVGGFLSLYEKVRGTRQRMTKDEIIKYFSHSRYGVVHDDGRFEVFPPSISAPEHLKGRQRYFGGDHDAELVKAALFLSSPHSDGEADE